jgi:hypothetical protein
LYIIKRFSSIKEKNQKIPLPRTAGNYRLIQFLIYGWNFRLQNFSLHPGQLRKPLPHHIASLQLIKLIALVLENNTKHQKRAYQSGTIKVESSPDTFRLKNEVTKKLKSSLGSLSFGITSGGGGLRYH